MEYRSISMICATMSGFLFLAGCQEPQVVEKEVPVEKPRCEPIVFQNPLEAYSVQIWAARPQPFYVGQLLRLQARSMADTFVSIYQVSSSCKTARLLDNVPAKGGQTVDFPSAASPIDFRLKPPPGQETYIMIATREPFDWLAKTDVLSEAAGVAALDMSQDELYSRLDQATSRLDPNSWNATTLVIDVLSN